MNTNYSHVVAGLMLFATGLNYTSAQTGLLFLNCPSSAVSLCVTDPGVRLPNNNQFYLGESDPNATSCSVHFTQQAEIHSDCSKSFQYKIEVSYYDTSAYHEILSWQEGITDDQDEANLTFDTENATDNEVSTHGLPYNLGCKRYHRIRWTVVDSCGNSAFCEKRIELYDCQAPTPISQGFKTLNFHSNYELQVSLNDIAGEYLDDCATASQYLFSTRSNIYQNDTLFKFCEVPIGVLVIVPIWIADQGRDLNCNGIISWDERIKYQVTTPVVFTGDGTQDCSNHDLFISGKIKTALGEGIAKTKVTVNDVNQSYAPVITDENGDYAFPHIDYTYPVTVTASRNDGVKNGVSTLDLVLIQKHLLGIEHFAHPDQFIAADASNSFSLSAIDLVIIRKLILGLVDTFPIGKSWRLFDTSLLSGNYNESIIIPSENKTANVDFIGVKLGDVNYTANPQFTSSISRSSLPVQNWTMDVQEYIPGDIVEIPIKCTASNSILGFQFTLSDPGLEFLGIKEGKADITSDDYALMKDQLTLSWFSVSPVDLKQGDILFTVVARAKAKGNLEQTFQLNSDITGAELYAANGEIFIPKILNKTAEIVRSGQEFLNCPSAPVSLCVNDPGVRLLANNQIYSSESDSNATSCSVHVTQSVKVKSNCGHQLQYGIQLFLDDTSSAYTIQPLTTIHTDSLNEAELIFNTELSTQSFIQKYGIPYNSGCMPYHRIKWIVIDSCGNFNECEELINLYDCQAPIDTTQIPLSIITLPIGGQITVYAKDFVRNIVDDCSAFEDLLFSFQPDSYQPQFTYSCNIPAFGVEIPSTLWVADKGSDTNCDGNITWEERRVYPYSYTLLFTGGDGCDPTLTNIITGKIYTEDLQPVELVSVYLMSPGHVFPTFITTQNGEYNFNNIIVPLDFTITAERDDNHKNGVTTLDLLKIQKHLLGKEIIHSPYDIIAADANNSQSVSAIDLIELRKLILGVYTKLPNNTSWRFVDKNYVFQDTLHPWPSTSPYEITGTATGNISDADFIGIKIGDINNTVQANAQAIVTREANKPIPFAIAPTSYEANEIVNINFSLEDLQSFNGFQFTFSDPDLEFLSASSNLIDLAEDNYALFGNKMTMSWFSLDEVTNHPGDIVFTVTALTKKSGNVRQSLQLNSDITEAELYSGHDETFIPKIVTKSHNEDQLTLFTADPNPWSTTCTIPFHVQHDGNLVFTVYDVNGAKLFSEEKYYSSGYHELKLNAGDVRADGLLFYTLQSETETQSGKFLLLY